MDKKRAKWLNSLCSMEEYGEPLIFWLLPPEY